MFKKTTASVCFFLFVMLVGCEPKSPVPPSGIKPVWTERLTEANGPVGVEAANALLVTRDYSPRVAALDPETRKERWHFDFPERHRFYFVGQVDGVAVASASNWDDTNAPSQTYGLDVTSGRELWHATGRPGVPTLMGGTVVVRLETQGKAGFDCLAYDARTGTERYKFSANPDDWAKAHPGTTFDAARFAEDGTAAVFTQSGKGKNTLFVFDTKGGAAREFPLAVRTGEASDTFLDPATFYRATVSGTKPRKFAVQAFDLQTGRKKWDVEMPGPEETSGKTPSFFGVTNDAVIVADRPDQMLALDLATGATKWKAALPGMNNTDGYVAVRLGGRSFIVNTEPLIAKRLVVWDAATGKEAWKAEFPDAELTRRVEARNGMLYIWTERSELVTKYLNVQRQVYSALYAYDLQSGKLAWRHVGATIDSVDYFKEWVLIRAGKEMLALPRK